MAEIKLYGNTVNGDGKYLVSPFDIAAPKSDGKTSYVEDDKAADKNIVAYINSKVGYINTSIGNINTGIKSATFSPLTSAPVLKSDNSVSSYIGLSVQGNDGSNAIGGFTITLPSANSIVKTASSYTNLVSVVDNLGTSYGKLNSTVATINGDSSKPGSFREGDKNTLEAAKTYTTNAVNGALGSVYKIQGTKTVAEVKALTKIPKGYVYNISESFKINGKKYPEYTNLVFIKDGVTDAVTWDSNKGFDSTQVDALGGVVDLEPYARVDCTVMKVSVTNNNSTFSDTGQSTSLATVDVTNGLNTSKNYNINAKLPTTLAKVSSPKLETSANSLKLTGLTDLSGTGVTPLSYKSVSANINSTPSSASNAQKLSILVKGELGSTSTSNYVELDKASTTTYGVVKIGDGLNSTGGTISAPKNTFNTTPYLSISYTTNSTKGNDFILDIVCQTAGQGATTIPLLKTDSATLGIEISRNSSYIKLEQAGLGLGVNETGLNTKIKSIEDRITALETLLSLA